MVDQWAPVLIDGLAYSMLLFLMAAGLSLIFGFMNVLNFAHGGFFALGAYVGLTVTDWSNFWVGVLVATVGGLLVGVVVERVLLARFYTRRHIDQAVITMGLTYIFADATQTLWGSGLYSPDLPAPADGTIGLGSGSYPVYRLFVLAVGLVVAVALWLGIEHTRIGATVRAGVSDQEMVGALGINIRLLYTVLFAVGVGLAALGGVLSSPILGVRPGVDVETFVLTLVVVVIGGLGSLRGAFVGAVAVGMTETIGIVLLPSFAAVFSYGLMALILLIRPAGLMGTKEA